MDNTQSAQARPFQRHLPWFIAAAFLILFLATLNHWVSLISLPFVAKATGWDWSLPQQNPLFFLVTFPVRLFPASLEPLLLNALSAGFGALALALLARSVMLLPHDRTHEQRLRERNEHGLLSIRMSWLPPVFAALVCGLQLTFWEHATTATNEMLDLLLFAYVIRSLLEYRIAKQDRWLYKASFVFALGITNSWAFIGFFPVFLIALVWIRGKSFFNLAFLGRLLLFGLLGLSLYLLLPIAWAATDRGLAFWDALRANLGNQYAYLFKIHGLRNRALLLSLTSLLPILIIGIRWPSHFGDTSAAGAALNNWMFRFVHIFFLVACIWVAFDQQFSPRELGMGFPFLTFYYLGALAIGYFSGYILLVFEDRRTRSPRKRSMAATAANRAIQAALLLAAVAVPIALLYKNIRVVVADQGEMLQQLAASAASQLPEEASVVLGDDTYSLLLLKGELKKSGRQDHLLLHTESLRLPAYQKFLSDRYPNRWRNLAGDDRNYLVSTFALQRAITDLASSHQLFYLHPSFGYFFERLYSEPHGLLLRLHSYPTNTVFPPELSAELIQSTQEFWQDQRGLLQTIASNAEREDVDALYASNFYSRGLNFFGVKLQRAGHLQEAAETFEDAFNLNTNNVPAFVNLRFNRSLRAEDRKPADVASNIADQFGVYRTWDAVLADNGPFDEPAFCYRLGEIMFGQSLFRQAAVHFNRSRILAPTNFKAHAGLANALLYGGWADRALETVEEIRQRPDLDLNLTNRLALVQLEATAYFSKGDMEKAESLIRQAQEETPGDLQLFSALVDFYIESGRWTNALEEIEKQILFDPKQSQLLFAKAEVLLTQKDYEKAIEVVDTILQQEPRNVQAILFKGITQLESGHVDPAIEQFDQVLRLHPNHPQALLSKGAALLQKEDFTEAANLMNTVLKRDPHSWPALRNRAIAHLKLGNLRQAEKDYQEILNIVPHNHAAYYGLAEISRTRGQDSKAIHFYEKYLKHLPPNPGPVLSQEKEEVEKRLQELKSN